MDNLDEMNSFFGFDDADNDLSQGVDFGEIGAADESEEIDESLFGLLEDEDAGVNNEEESDDDFGTIIENKEPVIFDESSKDEIGECSTDTLFDGLGETAISEHGAESVVNEAIIDNRLTDDTFEIKYIPFENIKVTANRIRHDYSIDSLVYSIKNEGLLLPITVAPLATDGAYVLIDGMRRLLACSRAGFTEMPCIINNNIKTTEIMLIEPIFSHYKEYTVQEKLDYTENIKENAGIGSYSMFEHLLNMDAGDYAKLMDIKEDGDPEIFGALLAGQMNIQAAYKKLEQKRKKMSKDAQTTARAAKVYDNATETGASMMQGAGEENGGADGSDEAVDALLNSLGSLKDVDDVDGETLRDEGNSINGFKPHKQDPNDRERLDPKLRKAVLARDNNTCQICEQISGQEYTEVLDVHHKKEVYLGGDDDINNLVTACTCCHKLIHLWGRGELHVRPFSEMDEAEARKFKRVMKLGNVIRQGMAERGMKVKELKQHDNADTIGRRLKGSSDQVAG